MGITSGASPGIEVLTAAVQTTGHTGAVGSASVITAANQEDETTDQFRQIAVPSDIATVNEGNLVASPVYPGRLIAIRAETDWVSATAVLTGTGQPSATETLTVSDIVYTMKSSISATAQDPYAVLIGATLAATLQNIADAINLEPDKEGVTYGLGTEIHPTFTAVAAATTVTVTARKRGRAGNARVDAAIQDDGGTYSKETRAANSATANDINLFPATKATGDRYLFGSFQPFKRFTINVGTAGVGTYTITWKYWDGSAWTALGNVTDGTSNFKTTGENDVTFDLPSDWVADTFEGLGPLYYIAAEVDAGTMTTNPIGTQAWSHGLMEETLTNATWGGDASGGVDGREIRYITAKADGTGNIDILTVLETWEAPPLLDGVTTDTQADDWCVSYIMVDIATVNGVTLVSKTGVYEFSRNFSVGSNPGDAEAGDFAFVFWGDGITVEPRDNGNNQTVFQRVDTIFQMGVLEGGFPTRGPWLVPSNDTDGEFVLGVANADLQYYFYDVKARATRARVRFTNLGGGNAGQIGEIIGCRFFRISQDFELTDQSVARDNVVAGVGNSLENYAAAKTTGGSGLEIDGETLENIGGGFIANTFTDGQVLLRNCRFIAPGQLVEIIADQNWDFVNPIGFVYDPSGQAEINFQSVTNNDCDVLIRFSGRIKDTNGNPIINVQTYVYEDLLNQDLPSANRQTTDRDGAFGSDALRVHITAASTSSALTEAFSGDYAWKAYKYGLTPLHRPVGTPAFEEPQTFTETMLVDPSITAVSRQAALAAVTGSPAIVFHRTGETDPRPMKVIAFDAGNGGTYQVGDVMLGGTSGADGQIVELLGSASGTGYLVLDTWDGVEFQDNETISNQTGGRTLSVTADTATFYEEVTVEIDAATNSMTAIYDWMVAQIAGDAPDAQAIKLIEWGGLEWALPLFRMDGEWNTVRNVANTEGVIVTNRGTGTVDYFTMDDGTQFVPPTVVTLELNNVVNGSRCSIHTKDAQGRADVELMNELAGVTGIVTEPYTYTTDTDVIIRVRKSSAAPKYFPYEAQGTITIDGLTVTVNQLADDIAA